MKGSDSQTPGSSCARDVGVGVLAHPDGEHDRVERMLELPQVERRPDRVAELEANAHLREGERLLRERVADDPVRRDRVADEPAGLGALVVDGDGEAAGGELAGAGEARRAGADHGDVAAVRALRRRPERNACRQRPVGRVALEARDLDRAASLVDEHAGALAELLDGTHPGARAAEQVVGEDRLRGGLRVALGDRGDECRHVHVGRARGDARSRRAAAALEAAVGLDHRLAVGERRPELVEDGRREALHPVMDAAGRGRQSHQGRHGRSCGKLAAACPQIARSFVPTVRLHDSVRPSRLSLAPSTERE